MDLISRQEALDALEWKWAGVGAINAVKALPTVDAVPVVRCKNCEYYREGDKWCRGLVLCGAFDPNGYCSHAERSEE